MNAQQLKNSILQEAIQGRLVPQDPTDEPASALLERIRGEKERLVKEGKLKKKDLVVNPISEDEIPFDIPDSWEWVRLGWIGDWGAGATPAKGNADYYNNGTIPWLRTGELNNGFVYDSEIKVTPKALEKCSLRMCEVGDVLIAMYGATIGKVAIAGIRLTTNQACCACTPFGVYNKYLLYFLMASKKTFIEMGEGGAQPNISREKIVAFRFPLPPLAEQKRIVAKIEELLPKVEEYGKAQEALNKLNAELPDRLKKSVLQEAIEGRLVPQDPTDEPASALLERIRGEKEQLVKEGKLKKKDLVVNPISEDEIPFDIPDSWEWVRLGTITTVLGGKRIPAGRKLSQNDTGHVYIRVSDMKDDTVSMDNLQYVPEDIFPSISRYIINKEDVFITVAGTIGRIGKIPSELDGANLTENADRLVFTIIDQDWLIKCLQSVIVQSQISAVTTQVGQPKLAILRIQNLLVPLPPIAEQKRIVAKIEEVFAEIDKLKK